MGLLPLMGWRKGSSQERTAASVGREEEEEGKRCAMNYVAMFHLCVQNGMILSSNFFISCLSSQISHFFIIYVAMATVITKSV